MANNQTQSIFSMMSRRRFLGVGAAAVAGAAIAATTTYLSLHDESQQLVVEHIQIPIKNLPSALEGFTLAQISDIHLYPFTKIELVKEAVQITNRLNADIAVLTGDYVWKDEEAIFELAPVLSQLNARYGVFTIMGNHDLWPDVTMIRAGFNQVNMPLLENKGIALPVGKSHLYLAGLDDGWSGKPNLSAAMENWVEGMPAVLLLHEPDLADEYAQDGRIGLHIAGHSHGGQIRLPRGGALVLPYLGRKYDQGLFNVNGMWLYTNRGIGVTNEPVRFNCPPEITEFTLVGA